MNFNKPKPFTPSSKSQMGKDWQIWKREFINYLRLSGAYETMTEEQRALLLQNLMGPEAIRAMQEISFDDPKDEDDMDILLMKFDEFFTPPVSEVTERFKFFSRYKSKNETIDDYVTDLKEMAKTCNFGNQTEKFIIDMIIRCMDNHLRQITFKQDITNIVDIMRSYKTYTADCDYIKELSETMAKGLNSNNKVTEDNTNNSSKDTKKTNTCWRCDTNHRMGFCPAYGKVCSVCKHKDHLDGFCSRRRDDSNKNNQKKPKATCSKCGMNHPYKQCPAYDSPCNNCNEKGHNANRCKKGKNSNINLNNDTSSQPQATSSNTVVPPLMEPILEDCIWCDSLHAQDQCAHDKTCANCDRFPHIICFSCKTNPHVDICIFKGMINLPIMGTNILRRCSLHSAYPTNAVCISCMRMNWRYLPTRAYNAEKSYVHVQREDVPRHVPPRPQTQQKNLFQNSTKNVPPKKSPKKDDCCIS